MKKQLRFKLQEEEWNGTRENGEVKRRGTGVFWQLLRIRLGVKLKKSRAEDETAPGGKQMQAEALSNFIATLLPGTPGVAGSKTRGGTARNLRELGRSHMVANKT